MEKEYTIVDKNNLFSFLDWYVFYSNEEIELAICDYIEKQEWSLYYSDCWLASELANEYINKKELYNIDYFVDWELVEY